MSNRGESNRSGSNRGGVWGFVLVFICAIVTIDVAYMHQKEFRHNLDLHHIGFSPPIKEEKKSGLTPQKLDTDVEKAKKNVQDKPVEKKTTNDKPVEKVAEKAGEKSPEEAKDKLSPVDKPKEAKHHKVAGLSCKPYGGPSDEDAAEMVYWQDIPVDASFVSPFKSKEQQYLTFEPGTFVM